MASHLKAILTVEAALYNMYLVMTRNLLVLYLVNVGMDMLAISFVLLLSTVVSTAVSILAYRYPGLITKRMNEKFIVTHGLEKVLFIPMAYTSDLVTVAVLYSVVSLSSTISTTYLNLAVYGLFTDDDVKDVIAKRAAASNITNVLGHVLTMFMVLVLPAEIKFQTIFIVGGMIGALSTLTITLISLRGLENVRIVDHFQEPEKLFSTSSYLVTLLTSGNLLSIVWTPFLVKGLGAEDYVVVAVNFAGSLAGIFSSIFWAKAPMKRLRISVALAALTPLLCMAVSDPILHIGISAYGGFAFVGANFVGSFLFARYRDIFGVLRVSLLMGIILNLSQLLATPFGILFRDDYALLFLATVVIRMISLLTAYLTIAEVAVIPEEDARTYSQILYRNSLLGYHVAADVAKESIVVALKFVSLLILLILVYVVYRFLIFLLSIS